MGYISADKQPGLYAPVDQQIVTLPAKKKMALGPGEQDSGKQAR